MPAELDVRRLGARLASWFLPATSDALTGPGGRPCVVMGHGLAATRDAGLLPFAERFAAAGADVVVFDYRGFGDSEGLPRQHVDHRRHREDYHAVIARARRLEGVDPARIVLWGSSYSGGHVLPVAAEDGRVAAVISQGAAMDGLVAVVEILRYAGLAQLLRLSAHAVVDAVGHLLGAPAHRIPVVGPPGSLATITAPGGEAGYRKIMGPTFRNEMAARGILGITLNRPVTAAPRVHCPLLVVVAADDNIAPPSAVRRAARTAGGEVEVLDLSCGHFDIYGGDAFATSVAAQVAFLERVCRVGSPDAADERSGQPSRT